jgi:hypothetical protein
VQADLRAVRRVLEHRLLQQLAARLPSSVGGRRSDSFTEVCGRSTLPADDERRHAVGAGDRQRRAPGAVEHQFGQVVAIGVMPGRNGNLS